MRDLRFQASNLHLDEMGKAWLARQTTRSVRLLLAVVGPVARGLLQASDEGNCGATASSKEPCFERRYAH